MDAIAECPSDEGTQESSVDSAVSTCFRVACVTRCKVKGEAAKDATSNGSGYPVPFLGQFQPNLPDLLTAKHIRAIPAADVGAAGKLRIGRQDQLASAPVPFDNTDRRPKP